MSKKTQQRRKFRARMLLFVPVCVGLICFLGVTIGNYWIEIAAEYQESKNLAEELILLKEKEAALSVDVDKLQDPEYQGRYAREKYNYSKEGEVIIRIPEE